MLRFQDFCENKNIEAVAKKAKVDIKGLAPEQLKMGLKVEKEHDDEMGKDVDIVPGHDKGTMLKIVVAHLREDPKYYTKLKKVEGE